jgi:hypothetical protein
MARPDRGVAQRYAARKRKKRSPVNRALAAEIEPMRSTESLDRRAAPQPLAGPLSRPEPQTSAPTLRTSRSARMGMTAPRPFSSYAGEYRYVLADLRRVALVAGSLMLCLVVLSFFIK